MFPLPLDLSVEDETLLVNPGEDERPIIDRSSTQAEKRVRDTWREIIGWSVRKGGVSNRWLMPPEPSVLGLWFRKWHVWNISTLRRHLEKTGFSG